MGRYPAPAAGGGGAFSGPFPWSTYSAEILATDTIVAAGYADAPTNPGPSVVVSPQEYVVGSGQAWLAVYCEASISGDGTNATFVAVDIGNGALQVPLLNRSAVALGTVHSLPGSAVGGVPGAGSQVLIGVPPTPNTTVKLVYRIAAGAGGAVATRRLVVGVFDRR